MNANESNGAADRAPAQTGARSDRLEQVRKLLDAGHPEQAHKILARHPANDPHTQNALGVCLLRMGQIEQAVRTLRGLVIGPGGISLKIDAPAMFKTNFATALLLSGQVSGCLDILSDIRDEQNPTVQQLRAAIKQWKGELTFGQRLRWNWGDDFDKPVVLNFRPGEV